MTRGILLKAKKYKKTATLLGDCFDVGTFLLSQAVASQVSSALMSLTSVFGMGTGGPSSSSTPTIYFVCRSHRRLLNNITESLKMQALF